MMLEVNLRGVLLDTESAKSRLLAPWTGRRRAATFVNSCLGDLGGTALLLVFTESVVAPRGLSLCLLWSSWATAEHLQGQGCLFQLGGEELLIESSTQVNDCTRVSAQSLSHVRLFVTPWTIAL